MLSNRRLRLKRKTNQSHGLRVLKPLKLPAHRTLMSTFSLWRPTSGGHLAVTSSTLIHPSARESIPSGCKTTPSGPESTPLGPESTGRPRQPPEDHQPEPRRPQCGGALVRSAGGPVAPREVRQAGDLRPPYIYVIDQRLGRARVAYEDLHF